MASWGNPEKCEGERFGNEGFPIKCEDHPVFELVHSSGRSLHLAKERTGLRSDRSQACGALKDSVPAGRRRKDLPFHLSGGSPFQ